MTYSPSENREGLMKQVAIDKLPEEGRKLGLGFQDPQLQDPAVYYENLTSTFLGALLQPKKWKPTSQKFPLKPENIYRLCDEVEYLFENHPVLARVEAPVKIFGSIHGQYYDLMRFFQKFSGPD